MDIKKVIMVGFVAMVVLATCAAQIRNVKAFQQYPWNGKVYISYDVEGNVTASAGSGKTPFLFVQAKDKTTGQVYGDVSSGESYLSGDTGTAAGSHKIVWDITAQGMMINSTNVTFTIMYCDELYQVIDLTSGANSSSYPVSYLYAVPSGGWADAYKKTKLVLRRISPGAFYMSGRVNVVLTKPFYMGVFEVTQKQYSLVMGTNPSKYTGDNRPVEQVSYDAIRGTSNGTKWPSSSAVDASSFMGKLRARTGLLFDLPTEAQWEYSCRAGTTSDYNNGGNSEEDLKKLGRYRGNTSDGKGGYSEHTIVGLYIPNAWGLYDMHGNVIEWSLDRYSNSLTGGIDPKGPSSGSDRVVRGGSWSGITDMGCSSSGRSGLQPSLNAWQPMTGFRISRTLK